MKQDLTGNRQDDIEQEMRKWSKKVEKKKRTNWKGKIRKDSKWQMEKMLKYRAKNSKYRINKMI